MTNESYYYPTDLKRIKIKRDGYCLYHAFAMSVENDENKYQQYLDDAVKFIEQDVDSYELLERVVDPNESLEANMKQYVHKIRTNELWGGDIEIQALSKKLHRNVILHQTHDKKVFQYPDPGKYNDTTILLYEPTSGRDHNRGHFDLLVYRDFNIEKKETDSVETKNGTELKNSNKYENEKPDTISELAAIIENYAQQEQQMKESYEKFTNLLVVKQLQTEVPEKKTELATLIETLREIEEELNEAKGTISDILQTSFLKIEDIMSIKFGDIAKVAPAVNSALDTIAEIARQENWITSDKECIARYLIYDVLCDLQSRSVLGDPNRNFFRVIRIYPGVFFLHCIGWIVYTPLCAILMILLMLARINGWFTLLIGFTSTTLAAIQIGGFSENGTMVNATMAEMQIIELNNNTMAVVDPSEFQNDTLASASFYLAFFTGILAAAKGINLEKDFLYQRPELLTIDILKQTFGIEYSKNAIFQSVTDLMHPYEAFATTLRVKKTDIRKIHDVRMFLAVVQSTSLVLNGNNYSEIVKLSNVLVRIEGVLLNPYNYITLKDLEAESGPAVKYKFTYLHVKEVKEYYNHITPVKSFCKFLEQLNNEDILPFYSDEKSSSVSNSSKPNNLDWSRCCGCFCCRTSNSNSTDITNGSSEREKKRNDIDKSKNLKTVPLPRTNSRDNHNSTTSHDIEKKRETFTANEHDEENPEEEYDVLNITKRKKHTSDDDVGNISTN